MVLEASGPALAACRGPSLGWSKTEAQCLDEGCNFSLFIPSPLGGKKNKERERGDAVGHLKQDSAAKLLGKSKCLT